LTVDGFCRFRIRACGLEGERPLRIALRQPVRLQLHQEQVAEPFEPVFRPRRRRVAGYDPVEWAMAWSADCPAS